MENNVLGYKVEELRQLVNLYPWFSWAREELLYKVVDIEPECLDDFYSNNLIFFPKRELVLFNARNIASKKSPIKSNKEKILLPDEISPVKTNEDLVEENLIDSSIDIEKEDEITKEVISEKLNSAIEELNDDDSKEVDLVNEVVVSREDFTVNVKGSEKEKDLSAEEDDVEGSECYSLMDGKGKEEIEFVKEDINKKIMVVGGDYFSQDDFNALDDGEKIEDIKVTPFRDKEDGNEVINRSLEKEINFDLPEFYTETLAKIYTEQECYKEAIDVYSKLILLYPEKSAYFASLVKEIKLKN